MVLNAWFLNRLPRAIRNRCGLVGMADVLEWYNWNTKRHRPHSSHYDCFTTQWIVSHTKCVLEDINQPLKSFFPIRKNPNPGLKLLFINYMINSGGNILFLLFTAVHTRIFVMSDFHDEKLLKAIEEVKVWRMDPIYACSIVLYEFRHKITI